MLTTKNKGKKIEKKEPDKINVNRIKLKKPD